jgi:hypothetical protein
VTFCVEAFLAALVFLAGVFCAALFCAGALAGVVFLTVLVAAAATFFAAAFFAVVVFFGAGAFFAGAAFSADATFAGTFLAVGAFLAVVGFAADFVGPAFDDVEELDDAGFFAGVAFLATEAVTRLAAAAVRLATFPAVVRGIVRPPGP